MPTDIAFFFFLVLYLFAQSVLGPFFIFYGSLSCYWKRSDAGGVVLHAYQVAVSSVSRQNYSVQNRLKQFCVRTHLFKVCGKGFAFLKSHREHSYSASGFYAEGCSLVEAARVKLVQLHLVIVMALPHREKERF